MKKGPEVFICGGGEAAHDRDKVFLAPAVPQALPSPKPRVGAGVQQDLGGSAALSGVTRFSQLPWEMLRAGKGCRDVSVWDTTNSVALFCFSVASQVQRH